MSSVQEWNKRTYKAAVELFAMDCGEYGLNPTANLTWTLLAQNLNLLMAA